MGSWKRVWNVISMLKARIEMIKVRAPDSTVGVTYGSLQMILRPLILRKKTCRLL